MRSVRPQPAYRRPQSALGYATPATYAAQPTAMGDRLPEAEALRRSSIAPSALRAIWPSDLSWRNAGVTAIEPQQCTTQQEVA
jgi:hypothetical protein